MNKILKGDQVIVVAGKDKGRTGTVLNLVGTEKLVVENINQVKKHQKPNPNLGQPGGIVSKDMPIHISNVAIFNSATNKADRIGIRTADDGKKYRAFKSTGEAVKG